VPVNGPRNSPHANRLVEVAREHGAASYLLDNGSEVRNEWLDGVEVVGITSGASAPEEPDFAGFRAGRRELGYVEG